MIIVMRMGVIIGVRMAFDRIVGEGVNKKVKSKS